MLERIRLPLTFAVLVLVVGVARIEGLRAELSWVLAVGIPAYALVRGVLPLRDSHPLLRDLAFAFTAVLLGTEELALVNRLSGDASGSYWTLALLLVCGAATLVLEALAVRRGLQTRFGAWSMLSIVFACFLSFGQDTGEPLSGVLIALVAGIFLGGGSGLLLSLLLRHVFRRG